MTFHVTNLANDVEPHSPSKVAASPGTHAGLYREGVKRVIDLTLVILCLPIFLPMIAALALMVAVTGGTPFYSQLRVGRDGRSFRMWKLRTMVKNAEAELENHLQRNPEARVEWENSQKLRNDPRITAVGRLMRKTSMDELPQLFNVFNGTMSLVGPRPMMVGQEKYYHGSAYYELRPGITGLWQVSDRNECCFSDRVTYDNTYSHTLSLKTDFHILLRTFGVVMRATGH